MPRLIGMYRDRMFAKTGKDLKYGVGLTLLQPVYTGGRLLETIRTAKYRHDITAYNEQLVRTAVCCHADVQYWNSVTLTGYITRRLVIYPFFITTLIASH